MPALRKFRLGGVTYPLDASTDKTLLEDADPALYWALRLFAFALKRYVGPRLLAQAKKSEELRLPSAVEAIVAYEPSPFVLAEDVKFPLFCLYRVEDEWSVTKAHVKSTSTWEWAYVLPPLTPKGIREIHPILRSVAVTMATFGVFSFDPDFEDGRTLRDLSGVMKIAPRPARYGNFERLEGEANKWWRAVTGQLVVEERDELVLEETEPFEGADIAIDLAGTNVETAADFVLLRTDPAPTIERVGPIEGPAGGGTPLEIYGTGFVPGSRTRVILGGAFADNVVVVHPTKLLCSSPPGIATIDGSGASLQVFNADGQGSNVLRNAYRFL